VWRENTRKVGVEGKYKKKKHFYHIIICPKALVSGGCVISGEINFDYRTFFPKQWCIIPLFVCSGISLIEIGVLMIKP
jgi:hypothetical protein